MRRPSRYLIHKVETKIEKLKKLRQGLDGEDLRCGSLELKIRNLIDEKDQLEDWYTECQLNGFC